LLVIGLLGGALVCLLVVNTTLGATSFRMSQLQRENAKLSLQEQSLQGTIQNEQAPEEIARRAYQLGMRAETNATILDLRTGRYYQLHDPASDLIAAGTTAPTVGVTTAGATGGEAASSGGAKHAVAKQGAAKPRTVKRGAARHRAAGHRATKHGATKHGATKHGATPTKAGSGQ